MEKLGNLPKVTGNVFFQTPKVICQFYFSNQTHVLMIIYFIFGIVKKWISSSPNTFNIELFS
jgi:hypothetical protein